MRNKALLKLKQQQNHMDNRETKKIHLITGFKQEIEGVINWGDEEVRGKWRDER